MQEHVSHSYPENRDADTHAVETVTEHIPCRFCGYDLYGLAGRGGWTTCPECGEEIDIRWREQTAPQELAAREASAICGTMVILVLFCTLAYVVTRVWFLMLPAVFVWYGGFRGAIRQSCDV
jgi:hypothetical protein